MNNNPEESYWLAADNLDHLIQALRQTGRQVIGPTLTDGAIVYDRIDAAEDLPQGWTDQQDKGSYRVARRSDNAYFGYNAGPHSWKKYLHPPRRQVFRAVQSNDALQFVAVDEPAQAMAFLGVRSCELHAMTIQGRVFGAESDYQNRRQHSFIVAVTCTVAAPTCFCTAMHTGPEVTLAYDLELTEVIDAQQHYFLVRSGSDEGERILSQLPLTASTAQHHAQRQEAVDRVRQQLETGPRHFDSSDLQSLLYRNYDSEAWDAIAERCLSCANCTLVCPTCFCTTEIDTTDLSGQHAERWQQWDSCFNADFSYLHGGSVRTSTRSRYRQWMTHKLATWHDQFGTSGCVGCGRCISWCPVGIDITEEINAIRKQESS